jgi:hypothetical protein
MVDTLQPSNDVRATAIGVAWAIVSKTGWQSKPDLVAISQMQRPPLNSSRKLHKLF